MNLQLDESVAFDPFLCYKSKHCAWSLKHFDEHLDVSELLDVFFALQIENSL